MGQCGCEMSSLRTSSTAKLSQRKTLPYGNSAWVYHAPCLFALTYHRRWSSSPFRGEGARPVHFIRHPSHAGNLPFHRLQNLLQWLLNQRVSYVPKCFPPAATSIRTSARISRSARRIWRQCPARTHALWRLGDQRQMRGFLIEDSLFDGCCLHSR